MKIVVVGGGVIGASVAWHLAREGAGEVVLLERDRLGSGTTWHSAGNITWKPLQDHDAQIIYALDTITRVEAESGRETGWLRTGRTFIARSERTLADFAEFDRVARERGIAARWLEPAAATAASAGDGATERSLYGCTHRPSPLAGEGRVGGARSAPRIAQHTISTSLSPHHRSCDNTPHPSSPARGEGLNTKYVHASESERGQLSEIVTT